MPAKGKNKKGRSGDPSKRDVSSASNWRKRSEGTAVELPSGNVALCRRVGLKAFLDRGAVPDYLAPIIQGVIREKSFMPPEQQKELVNDVKALAQTEDMMDRALVMTVLEPRVKMPPGCAECGQYLNLNDDNIHNPNSEKFGHDYIQSEREGDVVYADEVDMEDKVFLFQWSVGGGTDLQSFREGYRQSVEAVRALQVAPQPSKRVAGRR